MIPFPVLFLIVGSAVQVETPDYTTQPRATTPEAREATLRQAFRGHTSAQTDAATGNENIEALRVMVCKRPGCRTWR